VHIAHGFNQLRQVAPAQPQLVAALLRVLRMLIVHVERAGRKQHVPELRRQLELLLEAVETQPGPHPRDVARMRARGDGSGDPAEQTN
jgi:hypothetical protein